MRLQAIILAIFAGTSSQAASRDACLIENPSSHFGDLAPFDLGKRVVGTESFFAYDNKFVNRFQFALCGTSQRLSVTYYEATLEIPTIEVPKDVVIGVVQEAVLSVKTHSFPGLAKKLRAMGAEARAFTSGDATCGCQTYYDETKMTEDKT